MYIHNTDFKMDLVILLFNCYELLNVYAHLKLCIHVLHKPSKTLYTSNTCTCIIIIVFKELLICGILISTPVKEEGRVIS